MALAMEVIRGEEKEEIRYELCFDDGGGNGFAFPCDENGNVSDDMNPAAKKNYKYCMENQDKFFRANKVIKIVSRWREPNWGKCECGETLLLVNDYMGACQCSCGRWYNLFGQRLLPPDQWE